MQRYKRIWYIPAAVVLMVMIAVAGRATELHQEDGIMSNHSAEYVRTLNRNTSTDPDAAFYNPAGLAFMKQEGLHISFTSQTYYVKKIHSMDFYALHREERETLPKTPPHGQDYFRDCLPEEYMAELTAPCVPGLDVIWKGKKWAAYFDLAVMQAATNMTYGNGLAVMDWGNLLTSETQLDTNAIHLVQYDRNAIAVRNEMYLGFTLGGAYEITDWVSAGGGLRIIHAQGNMMLKMSNINFLQQEVVGGLYSLDISFEDWDISTDTSGFGFGAILSSHFKFGPLVSFLKGLDATFRFEYYSPMELEKTTVKFLAPTLIEQSGNLDIFKDGSEGPDMEYKSTTGNGSKVLKATYPSTVNFGLSYLLLQWIKIETSAQISFRAMRDLDGREKDYENGYQIGLGVEFILNPRITLSTGYLYNDFGIKDSKRTEADPLLDSHQIGAGGCFHIDKDLDINIGAFYQYFMPATVYQELYVNVSEPTYSYLRKDLEETRFSVSVGVTYRLFGGDSDDDDDDDDDMENDKKSDKNSNKDKKTDTGKNKDKKTDKDKTKDKTTDTGKTKDKKTDTGKTKKK